MPDSRFAMRCSPAFVPSPCRQQSRLQHCAIEGFVGGRTFQHVGDAQSQIGFLDHVEQTRHWPGRIEFGLERLQGRRIGLRIQWRERDPAAARGPNAHVRIFLQTSIQGTQCLAHLALHLTDKTIRIQRQIQRFVVFVAVRIEISRQILIRVAIAIGADDPDFLAAQLLAQDFQYRVNWSRCSHIAGDNRPWISA
jgi:hypothetical protein